MRVDIHAEIDFEEIVQIVIDNYEDIDSHDRGELLLRLNKDSPNKLNNDLMMTLLDATSLSVVDKMKFDYFLENFDDIKF